MNHFHSNKKCILSFFLFLLAFSPVHAASTQPNPPLVSSSLITFIAKFKPILTLTSGATLANLGKSQSFAPLDLCSYSYTPQNSDSSSMLLGAYLGSPIWTQSSWALTAGLGYYQPMTLSANGTLSQGADAASASSYQYSYKLKSQQLLVEGKLSRIIQNHFSPYLMLGVGSAFNTTYGYQTSAPPFLEFTPAFSSHRQTNFSYAAGAGVDFLLSSSFFFGLGYRFTDLGKANLGSAQIDATPISNTLKQSHVYANEVLVQLTYKPFA